MSRLEEIKDEYAKTLSYYAEWSHFIDGKSNYEVQMHMDNICAIYAEECVKASLEKASENGKVTHVNYGVVGEFIVVKESINNLENILLL